MRHDQASCAYTRRGLLVRPYVTSSACWTSCHLETWPWLFELWCLLLLPPLLSHTSSLLCHHCCGAASVLLLTVAGVCKEWKVPPRVGSVLAGLLARSSCCLTRLSPRVTETFIDTHLTARHLTDTFTVSTHPTEAGARPLQTPTLVRLLFLPLISCWHSVRGGAGG